MTAGYLARDIQTKPGAIEQHFDTLRRRQCVPLTTWLEWITPCYDWPHDNSTCPTTRVAKIRSINWQNTAKISENLQLLCLEFPN